MKTTTQIKQKITTCLVEAFTIIGLGSFLAYVAIGAAGWL